MASLPWRCLSSVSVQHSVSGPAPWRPDHVLHGNIRCPLCNSALGLSSLHKGKGMKQSANTQEEGGGSVYMQLRGTTTDQLLYWVLSCAVFRLIKKRTAVALSHGCTLESLKDNIKYMHSFGPSPHQCKQDFWWWNPSTLHKLSREWSWAPKGEHLSLAYKFKCGKHTHPHTHTLVHTPSIVDPGDTKHSSTHTLTYFSLIHWPSPLSGVLYKHTTLLGTKKDTKIIHSNFDP